MTIFVNPTIKNLFILHGVSHGCVLNFGKRDYLFWFVFYPLRRIHCEMAGNAGCSPSLLNKLYRFKREDTSTTLPDLSDNHNYTPVTNGVNVDVIDLDDEDIKPFHRKKITYCILDDDDDDDVQIISSDPVPSVSEEPNVVPEFPDDLNFEEKQVSLEFLEDAFPTKDKMELQDALACSNWNVEQAMAKLCEEKLSNNVQERFPAAAEVKFSPAPEVKFSSTPEVKFSQVSVVRYAGKSNVRCSDAAEVRCSDTPEVRCSPASVLRFSPAPVVKFSPAPEAKFSPAPEAKFSPAPEAKFSPTAEVKFSPAPEVRCPVSPEAKFSAVPKKKFSDTAKRKRDMKEAANAGTPPKKRATKGKLKYTDIEARDSGDDDGDAGWGKKKVFDSDNSDCETTDVGEREKNKVLEFLSTATIHELKAMSSCSQKKAEAIIEQRPFNSWQDLVDKFQNGKYLGTELLNSAQEILTTRREVKALMKRCMKLAYKLEKAVLEGATSIKEQPELLSDGLKLTAYQMVGLNWFMVLHNQKVNGILADEMGLGKTVQVIAFLAHLKKHRVLEKVPHLIIVPASTLDNWSNEFERWCPSMRVGVYYGHPDERRYLRAKWIKEGMADIDVILTTYNVLNTSPEDKKVFRVLEVHYVILDEGHMLKNMTTQRFETLMRINAKRRVLLTGTPVQNNLVELMSLLTFLMPNMFAGRKEDLKKIFSKGQKQTAENEKDQQPQFEQQQIAQARRIMKPFLLRRLKSEVLKELPKKTESVIKCPMNEKQKEKYENMIKTFSKAATQVDLSEANEGSGLSGMGMTMDLRKMANHPLLLRYHYKDEELKAISEHLARDPTYKGDKEELILEELLWMSDFQLHQLFLQDENLIKHALPNELIFESGKFQKFDELLPKLKSEGHRVLIFSQFVIMLDVVEEYLKLRDHSYLRLDGSTQVTFRQDLINNFNEDSSIFIFLLSTRAGGMGINLTAADTVIIHDIDFNPYNDKQAEDRCHRVGQSRDVTVIRFVSQDTIEEGIYQIAQEKLSLERQINSEDNVSDSKNVVCLLKQALGLETRPIK